MEGLNPKKYNEPPVWKQACKNGLVRTKALVWFLLKMVLPLYVGAEILMKTGVLSYMSSFLEPVMSIWGLPAEAAASLTIGLFASLYAAAALAAPLGLTPDQVTILGLILGIAHALPVEGAVIRELIPGRQYHLALLRIVVALATGWVMARILL